MDYFDRMIDGHFKTNRSGQEIFYHYRNSRSGVIIDSEKTKEKLHSFIKTNYICGALALIFLSGLVSLYAGIIISLIWHIWYIYALKNISANLAKIEEPSKEYEPQHSRTTLALEFVEVKGFAIFFVPYYFFVEEYDNQIIIAALIIFGSFFYSAGSMIWFRLIKPTKT